MFRFEICVFTIHSNPDIISPFYPVFPCPTRPLAPSPFSPRYCVIKVSLQRQLTDLGLNDERLELDAFPELIEALQNMFYAQGDRIANQVGAPRRVLRRWSIMLEFRSFPHSTNSIRVDHWLYFHWVRFVPENTSVDA